jgi:hypothetical protein
MATRKAATGKKTVVREVTVNGTYKHKTLNSTLVVLDVNPHTEVAKVQFPGAEPTHMYVAELLGKYELVS